MARRDRYALRSQLDTSSGSITGTAYRLLYIDSAGVLQELAHGTSGQVLTSNGASADPSWQAAAGGLSNVVEDTTPQLGGQLDANGNSITDALGDLTLTASSSVLLQEASTTVFSTTVDGITIVDDTRPKIEFRATSPTGTLRAQLQSWSDNTFYIDNRVTSANMTFRVSHLSAADETALTLVPDGAVQLAYQGTNTAETRANGLNILAATSANAQIRFKENTTDKGLVFYDATNNRMEIRAMQNSDHVLLSAADAVGTVDNVFLGDPDGAAILYYAGVAALETLSGSIKFGTHTAIGAETVTGYITIQDSGGTSRKLAVVS